MYLQVPMPKNLANIVHFVEGIVTYHLYCIRRIQEATGLTGIEGKICDILGFCLKQQKVVPGMLAEATTPQIKVNITPSPKSR